MIANPKVFISHAREDKERFVLGFAKKLYSKGIEAWVDEWEMRPGDSLVDKIWDEGIGQAQAMIVVISEYSVDKRWVKAELNTGVVRRIEGHSKLIPVIIGNVDKSQIPESLADTVWKRIKDLNNYEAEFTSIVDAIYDQRERPELGDPPSYVQMEIHTISDLTEVDSLILKLCCEAAIEEGQPQITLKPDALIRLVASFDIHPDQALESIDILESRGYITTMRTISGVIFNLRLTFYGFDEYAQTYVPDFNSLHRAVALQIVNHNSKVVEEIAKALNRPPVIVDHILRGLSNRGLIKAQQFPAGFLYVHGPTAELRRWLRQT